MFRADSSRADLHPLFRELITPRRISDDKEILPGRPFTPSTCMVCSCKILVWATDVNQGCESEIYVNNRSYLTQTILGTIIGTIITQWMG